MEAPRLTLFDPNSLNDSDFPPAIAAAGGNRGYVPPTNRTAQDPAPEGQPSLRLRAVFHAYHKPYLQQARRAASTLKDIAIAIKKWEKFTNNLPVPEIDDDELVAFTNGMEREGLAARTINKNLGHVMAILKTCTPRTPQMPRGRPKHKVLVDELPFAPTVPPDPKKRRRRKIVDGRLESMFNATHAANWPRYQVSPGYRRSVGSGPGTPTHAVWRLLVAMLTCCGWRLKETFLFPASGVHRDPKHPHFDHGVELEWPHGWLSVTQSKIGRYQPEPLIVPCPPVVRRLIDELDEVWPLEDRPRVSKDSDDRRLMPFSTCHGYWYEQLDRIVAAADPNGEWGKPYRPQEFRKTLNNFLRSALDADAARFALGHTARDVNAEWYSEFSEDLCRAWRDKLIALPDCFLE